MAMHSPLEGLRVIDLTQAMAGPMASMLLGDLGAEIIKVEPPSGDQTRSWAPPYINGMSAYFLSANRNKRSIVLDLKSEGGKEVLGRLVRTADVLIENFRPGTLAKLGFDYETVRGINPEIIYCSLSGYGQSGPQKNWPGYDLTVLASSGLMSINGEEGRPPVKFGVPIADITSGMFADIAIMSALYERKESGEGQYIDMSMLDGNFMILTHQAFSYFATGKNPKKLGSAHSSISPYQVFEASDGYIAIAVGTEKLWGEFCRCIDREDLIANPLFASNVERVRNRDDLVPELNRTFASTPVAQLFDKLRKAGIPAAPINTVGDAVNNEQIKQREMVTEISAPYGEIPMLGTPFKLSRTPGKIRKAPPMLGEDTGDILKSLNFTQEEIEKMKSAGAINKDVKNDVK
ncbi:MAG: CoA transferase [Candidatus Thermoplasmatota archaeon]|nr:CoA transferase [Candidatus Thermoplasmatota archaeon]